VAQALACDALDKQPLIVVRVIYETPLNRILPEVFEFLLQFRRMPDNVIETLITPDRAFTVEHLVDPAGRTALNALKDLAQLVWFNEPEDQMGMIGHYHRGIQVNARLDRTPQWPPSPDPEPELKDLR